jgi:hypothetical protein
MLDLKSAAIGLGVLIALVSPRMACATLGEPEASVQIDAVQLRGSIKDSNDRSLYRLHEISLPTGTSLREFVGLDGQVFAVAWSGPFPPNLRQAFGRYFDTYVTAAKNHRLDHNHLMVQQADLVVQARGHARAYSGLAYLPGSLPAGFALGDLK